jgi:hypothetical protein
MLGTLLSPKNAISKNGHLGRQGGFGPPEPPGSAPGHSLWGTGRLKGDADYQLG